MEQSPHRPAFDAKMLTPAVEDYLKAILHLEQDEPASGTAELARRLSVSPASVTNMLKRLAQMGMVAYTSYRGFSLTEPGRKIALEILRHQRLLELYLTEALGYGWDEVHREAEKLEHHISEEFEDRIDALLGYPTHDPHGDPIPGRDGTIPSYSTTPLTQARDHAQAGQELVIQRVSEQNPELLRYLAELGLKPQTTLRVLEQAPFKGPLTLEVNGQRLVIGHEVGSHIFVEPVG